MLNGYEHGQPKWIFQILAPDELVAAQIIIGFFLLCVDINSHKSSKNEMNSSTDSQNGYWHTYCSAYGVLGNSLFFFADLCCLVHLPARYLFVLLHAKSTSSFVLCAKISLS